MASGDSDIGVIFEAAALAREEEIAALRAERNRQPFVVPGFGSTDDENYNRCLFPAQALAALGLSSRALAVTQLERELKAGRVKAICHQAKMLLNGESNSVLRAIIDPWVWFLSFPAPDSDFWETGYHHDHLPKTYGRTSWQGDIELFRVRFLLDDLTAGADHPAPANAAARTPLPKAEAERVSRAILEIWTNTVTEARALELARGMCTDHKVSRDPFLETFRVIRGGKKPGKPASNDK